MQPQSPNNLPGAQSPQPQVPQPQPIQPAQTNKSEKKIKNAGRSVLIAGIFFTIIVLLASITSSTNSSNSQIWAMIGVGIVAVFGISWVTLGILIMKSKDNLPKASKIVLTTLIITITALIIRLLQANINLGTLIVVVLAIYLVVSHIGLRKLSRTNL